MLSYQRQFRKQSLLMLPDTGFDARAPLPLELAPVRSADSWVPRWHTEGPGWQQPWTSHFPPPAEVASSCDHPVFLVEKGGVAFPFPRV